MMFPHCITNIGPEDQVSLAGMLLYKLQKKLRRS